MADAPRPKPIPPAPPPPVTKPVRPGDYTTKPLDPPVKK